MTQTALALDAALESEPEYTVKLYRGYDYVTVKAGSPREAVAKAQRKSTGVPVEVDRLDPDCSGNGETWSIIGTCDECGIAILDGEWHGGDGRRIPYICAPCMGDLSEM